MFVFFVVWVTTTRFRTLFLVFTTSWQLRGARSMGNHPDNQRVSDANQWPHHFNMLGQLLLGFIFMIVVFFLYVVRPSRPRSLRSASDRTKPIDRARPRRPPR